ADDPAWGPHGGESVVMMADRRGSPVRPVNPQYVDDFRKSGRAFSQWLGFDVPERYPGAPGVVSTVGQPDKGRAIERSFARSSPWPQLAPGLRGFVTLAGDHQAGPVILTLAGDPAALVLPAATFGTEVVLLVVKGTASIGQATLETAHMRIVEAG